MQFYLQLETHYFFSLILYLHLHTLLILYLHYLNTLGILQYVTKRLSKFIPVYTFPAQ